MYLQVRRAWYNYSILILFLNDTATTEIYTLSLHDALPIYFSKTLDSVALGWPACLRAVAATALLVEEASKLTMGQPLTVMTRSEEHTSELQSRQYLVCRLLLEKKKSHLLCLVSSTHFSLML